MDKCSAQKLLKVSKTKITDARSKILDTLLDCKTPVSAGQLHSMLPESAQTDLATVYRTLKTLCDKGIARAVSIDGDTVYYEKSCVHNPLHAHFFCESCKKVECLHPFGFDESAAFFNMAEGNAVKSVELLLKGRCRECERS